MQRGWGVLTMASAREYRQKTELVDQARAGLAKSEVCHKNRPWRGQSPDRTAPPRRRAGAAARWRARRAGRIGQSDPEWPLLADTDANPTTAPDPLRTW